MFNYIKENMHSIKLECGTNIPLDCEHCKRNIDKHCYHDGCTLPCYNHHCTVELYVNELLSDAHIDVALNAMYHQEKFNEFFKHWIICWNKIHPNKKIGV